jgi:hypothetical protein
MPSPEHLAFGTPPAVKNINARRSIAEIHGIRLHLLNFYCAKLTLAPWGIAGQGVCIFESSGGKSHFLMFQ